MSAAYNFNRVTCIVDQLHLQSCVSSGLECSISQSVTCSRLETDFNKSAVQTGTQADFQVTVAQTRSCISVRFHRGRQPAVVFNEHLCFQTNIFLFVFCEALCPLSRCIAHPFISKQPAVGGYFNTLYNHTSIHGRIVSFSKTLGGQKFSEKEQIMKLNFREL